MANLRFDGKVVLITGAGAGLGREYALDFAKRGASVVVNDLGTNKDGRGVQSAAADSVVKEIRDLGGKAVANYDSVEHGEKLVKTALENYGRIDVVINNAGILRDRTFARMSAEEWDLIHRVHLRAAFTVTRAAWQHMRQQRFGRVIFTSSPSGIYGNFGQANYGAAKLGLVGLMNTLALEGKKHGILVNTIAPTAHTRLTEGLMPKEVLEDLKPSFIMPLVVYLCHDSYSDTGGLFELSGGHVSKLRWQRTKGAALRAPGHDMTAEDVRDNWEAVTSWDDPVITESIQDTNLLAVRQIQRMKAGDHDLGSNHPIRPALAKRHKFQPITTRHDPYKVILYALGVGMSTKQEDHLKFLFEGDDNFCVLPSFGVIPPFEAMGRMGEADGLTINPTQILHGEQYLELYKPIPTDATLTSHMRIVDVLDKGSGCAIITNVETFDESGEKVFFNQFVTFVVGAGGFRGQRSSSELKPHVAAPRRAPDASAEETTTQDQAALYRLSGDLNPLHIEPGFAAMGGFKRPILHGLCTFGFAARHVMEKFGGNDPRNIKAIKARFTNPVVPGDRLRTDMWLEGRRVHFQTTNVDSGKVALAGAYVDLVDSKSTSPAKPVPAAVELASDAMFAMAAERVDAEVVRKVGAEFRWNITRDGKVVKAWHMDLKNGSGSVRAAADDDVKADCTLTISDDDVVAIFGGKLNPQQAFFSGKMKLGGNMMLAQKLEVIFKAAAPKL